MRVIVDQQFQFFVFGQSRDIYGQPEETYTVKKPIYTLTYCQNVCILKSLFRLLLLVYLVTFWWGFSQLRNVPLPFRPPSDTQEWPLDKFANNIPQYYNLYFKSKPTIEYVQTLILTVGLGGEIRTFQFCFMQLVDFKVCFLSSFNAFRFVLYLQYTYSYRKANFFLRNVLMKVFRLILSFLI